MAKQMAILDIGSSKVVCLICGINDDKTLVVHGAGVKGYKGYKYQRFISERSLTSAIEDAVVSAENDAKRRIRNIVVGVNAPFCKVEISRGAIQVNNRISMREVRSLIADSYRNLVPPVGFEPIQATPVSFTVDNSENMLDMPIGTHAEELSGVVSHVFVDSGYKQTVGNALYGLKIDVAGFIAVPQALGAFMLPSDERASDSIIVDVGSTHTDVIRQRNTAIIDMRTIDVGGIHFATDLSYIFKTSFIESERIKRNHTFGLDYSGGFIDAKSENGDVLTLEALSVQEVIDARAMELADLIAYAIEDMGVSIADGSKVYFTGGGMILMRGSAEFLSKYLHIEAVSAMPWMPRLSTHNYASAYAVMITALKQMDEIANGESVVDKLKNLFRQ